MAIAPLPLSQLTDTSWHLDCMGMLCPVPIIKTGRAIRRIEQGHELVVVADDPGVEGDLADWCAANRQDLLSMQAEDGTWTARIRRAR